MGLVKGYKGILYFRYIKPETGNYTNISTGTCDRNEAERFVEDFKADPRNKILSRKNVTIKDFNNELQKLKQSVLSPESLYFYKTSLNYLEKFIGNKFIRFIDRKDIELYMAERLKTHVNKKSRKFDVKFVSKSTVNLEIRTLKAIFYIAKNYGYVFLNPVVGIKQLKTSQRDRNIKNHEIQKLREHFLTNKDILMYNIFNFNLYSGCRISEILNIQWNDIEMETGIIQIVNKDNFKTKNFENRKFNINPELNKLLMTLEKNYLEQGLDKASYGARYLFCKENGSRYNKDYISRRFKKAVRTLGLPDTIYFHCTRFTTIRLMHEKGISTSQIQKAIGHKSIQTTEYYINAVTPDIKEAINSINI